jgi:hypothetical protein
MVNIKNAGTDFSWKADMQKDSPVFAGVKSKVNPPFVQAETDFADFNIQKLLPHKFSEYGPSMAAGDIDGNGLDDFICGGSANNSAIIFLQQKNGTFVKKQLLPENVTAFKKWDDAGLLLFDADRDGDLDLYISSGGYENESNTEAYQDHFYINNGKGEFTEDKACLPRNFVSKSCVRAADIDHDGDLDLFVAGRVDPWNYPKPVSSFIFRNDTEDGKIKFTDITAEAAPALVNAGLVCDALFSDFDNDGWQDLIIAGEWMPLTFLKNTNGTFSNISASTGTGDKKGWWTSITSGDFDNDGDIDYIVGNLGLNSFFRASRKFPISIYAADFDLNGSYDAFTSIWLASSQQDTTRKEYPVDGRDDAIKQMISMRARFQNYKSYAVSTIDKLFTEDQLKKSLKLEVNYLASSYCRNDGNGKFTLMELPATAQLSALNGMITGDFNCDGNLDVIFSTNDFGTEVSVGRYDALNGLMLEGDGKGGFRVISIAESGIYIPGNGKALVSLKGVDGSYIVAAGQNRGPLKFFELRKKCELVRLHPDDVSAELIYRDGKKRKTEFYYGSSFLSQSARYLDADENLESAIITDASGKKRNVPLFQSVRLND